jgi:predicted Zn-dependent protease with MMP-like domain
MIAALRTLIFDRLEEINRDLTQLLADLAVQIDDRNTSASILHMEVESRIQAMRNILLVLREHLGG